MRLISRPVRFGILLGATAVACYATTRPVPLLDTMTDEFEQAAVRWEKNITAVALRLFFLLATLDVIWTGLTIALKGSGLQEFVAELVRRLLFIGFFLALLLNASDWSRAIVNSFQQIGTQAIQDTVGSDLDENDFGASKGALKPSAIAAKGILYSRRIANSAPSIFVHPGGSVFFGLSSLFVLGGFAAIAARQVMILAEMYVVLSAGILVLGFGAARWTNEYAVKYLRYCVSVGAKLMFVQLSVALALHFLGSLTTNSSTFSFSRAASVALALSVLVVLIWTIPNIVAQFMQGQSATSGNELMSSGQIANAIMRSSNPLGAAGGQTVMTAARMGLAQSGVQPRSAANGLGSALGLGMARPIGALGGLASKGANALGRTGHPSRHAPPSGGSNPAEAANGSSSKGLDDSRLPDREQSPGSE